MSDKPNQTDGPLSRWARRKSAARKQRETPATQTANDAALTASLSPGLDSSDNKNLPVHGAQDTNGAQSGNEAEAEPVTAQPEVELPDIDSLNEDSDYSAFMAPNVSGELRNLALRKLFKSSVFNIRDGLDDYDEDFTTFEKLGDIVTADMRHHAERKEKERLAQEQEALEEPREDDQENNLASANSEQPSDKTPSKSTQQDTGKTEPIRTETPGVTAESEPTPAIRPTDADATLMSGKIRRRPNDPA